MAQPMPAKSRKGAQTRARLVDAAKVVFERDGFLDARIGDIAAEAGMSQGSFYHYFDSKEEVFREIAADQEARLLEAARVTVDTAGPTAGLELAIRSFLEYYRDEAKLMRVIEMMARYDPEVSAARLASLRHSRETSVAGIELLLGAGMGDQSLDPAIAAEALGAMLTRYAELWLVQDFADHKFEDVVQQLTRLSANALGIAESTHR